MWRTLRISSLDEAKWHAGMLVAWPSREIPKQWKSESGSGSVNTCEELWLVTNDWVAYNLQGFLLRTFILQWQLPLPASITGINGRRCSQTCYRPTGHPRPYCRGQKDCALGRVQVTLHLKCIVTIPD